MKLTKILQQEESSKSAFCIQTYRQCPMLTGYGMPIGGVMAAGVIVPNAVGVEYCGMCG